MIAHLKGRLDATGIDHAVIDVGGVGYLVGASARTLSALGPVGEAAMLHTEMLVSDDSIRLVGFAHAAERDWFRLLTGVQGVGARVALAILSAFDPGDLSRAVAAQDKAMVARANGVGPKLAERIVRELKDKIGGGRDIDRRRDPGRAGGGGSGCGVRAAEPGLPPRRSECRGGIGGGGTGGGRRAGRAGAAGAAQGGEVSGGSLDGVRGAAYIEGMAQVHVSLPVDLQHYVDTRVSVEGYADPGDFLRDLIRRDQDAHDADVRRLRVLWEEGVRSGIVDAEPENVLDQIIAEIPARDGAA